MDSSAACLLRESPGLHLLLLLAEYADYGLSLAQRLAAAGSDEIPSSMFCLALMRLEKCGLAAAS